MEGIAGVDVFTSKCASCKPYLEGEMDLNNYSALLQSSFTVTLKSQIRGT